MSLHRLLRIEWLQYVQPFRRLRQAHELFPGRFSYIKLFYANHQAHRAIGRK